MKTFRLLSGALAAAFAVLPALAGDPAPAPSADPAAAADPADPEEAMQRLFADLQEKFEAGDLDGVADGFKAALDDPVHAPNAPRLFSIYLGFLLQTGRIEEAKAAYLGALRTDPERAEPCSGYIYGYLLETGDRDGALDWARTLLTQDIPETYLVSATEWLATGLLSAGDRAGAFAAATNGLARFPAASFAPVAERFARAALAGKDLTTAEDFLAAIEGREGYAPASACLHLRLLGARGRFGEAAEALPGLRGKAPDADLLRALRDVFSAARAAGDDAGLDAVAAAGALDPAFRGASGIRLASAREWLGVPLRGEGGAALYAQRLDRLLSLDFPPSQLLGLWTRYFYDVLGDLDALRSVAASGREIKKRLSDDSDRETMRVYELDADFLLGEYDACAAILDEGIPDHDAAWHEMMKTKVLAHKAEAAGDWAAAAEGFSRFVDLIPDEDQQDPTSSIVYSRSTLVGNNQRRIAGLWEKAGKPDKASAALVAARKAYRKALESNTAGKETADYIEAQMKALDEK